MKLGREVELCFDVDRFSFKRYPGRQASCAGKKLELASYFGGEPRSLRKRLNVERQRWRLQQGSLMIEREGRNEVNPLLIGQNYISIGVGSLTG